MPYPLYKFDGVKFLESGKSSFRFLHVHSHIDPINYIHAFQQVVGLRYCQFSYGASTKCIGYNFTICMESKKISNDQELIQSDPISCPQNQKKGNN